MKKPAHQLASREGQAHDRQFIRRFAGVIAGLCAMAGVFALIGREVQQHYAHIRRAEVEIAALEARTAPIGRVITDPKQLPPPPAAAPAGQPGQPSSGDQTVAEVCSACHQAGVMGAPKIGDASAWKARKQADGGVDGLARSAAKGKGSMPPRGGRQDLSDQDLKAAIETMLKRSGA